MVTFAGTSIHGVKHTTDLGHDNYTLRTQFPHSLLIYEHNAHAMTLCGVHARKHVYMYGGPHVC